MNTEKEKKEDVKKEFKYTPDIVGFTEEEYKKAKVQFGKMFHVKIIDIDGTRSDFMIRRPPMVVMKAIKDCFKKGAEDEADELMVNSCVVCGDLSMVWNDVMIFNTVNTELKKLTEASSVFTTQA